MAFFETMTFDEVFFITIIVLGVLFVAGGLYMALRKPAEPIRKPTIDEIHGDKDDWDDLRDIIRENNRRNARSRGFGGGGTSRRGGGNRHDSGHYGLGVHHGTGFGGGFGGDSGGSGSSGGGGCGGGMGGGM